MGLIGSHGLDRYVDAVRTTDAPQPRSALLAIDGGKSGTRCRTRLGDAVRNGTAPGSVYRSGEDDAASLVRVLEATLEAVGRPQVTAACLGLTSCPGSPEGRQVIAEWAADRTGAATVVITGDAAPAHAGALDGPGVLISAGTGTIALAISDDGRHAYGDGWGPQLGDRGSAYDLGRSGLRAGLMATEGLGSTTVLTERVVELLGSTDLESLQRFARDPDQQSVICTFSRAVTSAANQGDGVARDLCLRAATSLAETTLATADRCGLVGGGWNVAVVGGLGRDPAVGEPLRAQLRAAGLSPVEPLGDALDGGLALAEDRLHSGMLYAPLIHRINVGTGT